MPPMDSTVSYFDGQWLINPDVYDVKTEAGGFPESLINSLSSRDSCMSKVDRVFNLRTANLSPASPHVSPLAEGDSGQMKPAKCAFSSTVTSAQRVDPCSLHGLVSTLPMQTRVGETTSFLQKEGWSASLPSIPQEFARGSFAGLGAGCLVNPGSSAFGGKSAATESTALLHKESQLVRRNTVQSCSGDASVDDILTNGSTASLTSGYLSTEQEDEDGIGATSAEPPPLQLGRSPSHGVTATAAGAIAMPDEDHQQEMPGLEDVGGNSHSGDQRDLGSPRLVGIGAQQDQESILIDDSRCFPASDDFATAMVMERKPSQGDLETIVSDRSWGKEELKESLGFLPGQIPNGVHAATAPVVPTSSFLPRGSSNLRRAETDTSNLTALNATLKTVVANKSASASGHSALAGHLGPAMLLRAPFPVVGVDLAAVENSRPKRRNVKISKDPQSVAARHRRERISDRIRILQRLVPGGTKMDTASMLDEAIQYVKFLKSQVQSMETATNATGGFDPRLTFVSGSLYRTGIPAIPYSPMAMDCSQGVGSADMDYSVLREGFPPLLDSNFPVQFCH